MVLGSGAAGFQTAIRLYSLGHRDTVLVTEGINFGTSRNTGSDKQTYYKLSLASGDQDSVLTMAEDLFSGGAVDGDQALCEAALSVRSFFRLVELGVPFPCTEYGEYMGYKTDHDRGRRATSAGPYTSKLMTECLEREARKESVMMLDKLQAIKILVKGNRLYGLLCLDRDSLGYVLIWCKNLVMATGGPAGMYRDSVYPASQTGASGLAFEAGVKGKNLTEWQFGLASLKPRWNVSGTYMQVLPCFISTDKDGGDEREFLLDFFKAPEEALSLVFLKGYQWPFDAAKIFGGSSMVDLLVYQETVLRGRRVYLDFTRNPGNGEIDYQKLRSEAYEYLKAAGALFGTPVERLEKMNAPAVSFYMDHGVDLHKDRLEIAVSAQHNNGGLSTDADWQSGVEGLYVAGEANGSHGVTRPGGSALNAGQVGAVRASEHIHLKRQREDDYDAEKELLAEAESFITLPDKATGTSSPVELYRKAVSRMSSSGGMIRSKDVITEALGETERELEDFTSIVSKPDPKQLYMFYRLRDTLISQKVYLSAMLDYLEKGGGSRGSALYTNPGGKLPDERMPELYRSVLDNGRHSALVQETGLSGSLWRPVRPIPEVDYFFENQWALYRKRQGL